MNVDLPAIRKAMDIYQSLGYTDISVPYVVDRDVSEVTLPQDKEATYHHGRKVYSGSAEQGFLQLMKDGQLPAGKYMALTPCVRDDEPDETHAQVFMKLELIWVDPPGEMSALSVAAQATYVMKCFGIDAFSVPTDEAEDSWDLETGSGLELGSYGIRVYRGRRYIYGTGLAEPRFSLAKQENVYEK